MRVCVPAIGARRGRSSRRRRLTQSRAAPRRARRAISWARRSWRRSWGRSRRGSRPRRAPSRRRRARPQARPPTACRRRALFCSPGRRGWRHAFACRTRRRLRHCKIQARRARPERPFALLPAGPGTPPSARQSRDRRPPARRAAPGRGRRARRRARSQGPGSASRGRQGKEKTSRRSFHALSPHSGSKLRMPAATGFMRKSTSVRSTSLFDRAIWSLFGRRRPAGLRRERKAPRGGGWGAESSYGSMQVCGAVMQSDLARSSGPYPIRRHSPSNDGRLSTPYGRHLPQQAGEGVRAAI